MAMTYCYRHHVYHEHDELCPMCENEPEPSSDDAVADALSRILDRQPEVIHVPRKRTTPVDTLDD